MNRGEHGGELTGKWVGADVSIYRFEDLEGQNGPMSIFISGQPLPQLKGKPRAPQLVASREEQQEAAPSGAWWMKRIRKCQQR